LTKNDELGDEESTRRETEDVGAVETAEKSEAQRSGEKISSKKCLMAL